MDVKIKFITLMALLLFYFSSCSSHYKYADLQSALNEYAESRDANIGVAVIIDGKDTVSVNGHKPFPMLSVYKFPIALALADVYRGNKLTFDHQIKIFPEDLHLDTWSPMTEKLLASDNALTDTLKLSARDLLQYMLQQSDNNASDIVLNSIGGISSVNFPGINVVSTEAEMHTDNNLCYANSSTPIAMAKLIDSFDREMNDSLSLEIKYIMQSCATGDSRLAKPLLSANAVIGHKTGTGFTLPDGRLMAVNDAGYIHLPDGRRYVISVFIENSGYSMEQTEAIIAEISDLVFREVSDD